MGCHTWFYKKLNPQPTYEEVKLNVIEHFKKEIDFCNKLIFDRNSIDKDLLEAYPEWTIEYAEKDKCINERKKRIVEKNLCQKAVCSRYRIDDLFEYIDNKGFYISEDNMPHDIFRIGNYPNDKLFSLEETLYFIEKNKEKIYYSNDKEIVLKKLNEFWTNYPEGMINFG